MHIFWVIPFVKQQNTLLVDQHKKTGQSKADKYPTSHF